MKADQPDDPDEQRQISLDKRMYWRAIGQDIDRINSLPIEPSVIVSVLRNNIDFAEKHLKYCKDKLEVATAEERPAIEAEIAQLQDQLAKFKAKLHAMLPAPAASNEGAYVEVPAIAKRRPIARREITKFGRRLRKLKDVTQLTWDEIAAKSDVSRRQLLALANEGANPTVETKTALSNFFSNTLDRTIRL